MGGCLFGLALSQAGKYHYVATVLPHSRDCLKSLPSGSRLGNNGSVFSTLQSDERLVRDQ